MKIDVLWSPSELEGVSVQDRVAVVIDVLRAGTTIATAIRHGARAIFPVASIEEAMRLATSLGRGEVLLCGERQGLRVEGFDLGNSPAEFSFDLSDRTIVMTTTNGTRALAALSAAKVTYVASLVNLSAVAQQLGAAGGEPLIVCAGREGRVSAEDALCAGLLVERLVNEGPLISGGAAGAQLGDGAVAALALARAYSPADVLFLRNTAAGCALEKIGQGRDIELCAQVDAIPEIPVFRERQVTRLDLATELGSGGRQKAV
ncbi:MAG: 2-phosphosulfolactate phosphatase [Gemmatimonadota bacterium]|nr:MAG: 2-phosphosulfolactate phosphatase [Gemmatimonadota bacterium]